MSAILLNRALSFDTETCITCGVVFTLPSELVVQRRRDHTNFYCPNGHSQFYPGKSDVELAREALAAEKSRHAETLARLNDTTIERDKIKKRIAGGTCPCCNRSFIRLARHMKTKHPNFVKGK